MEIKVVIDLSERAAAILSSIATALIIKGTAAQPDCTDADEKLAKERKAAKKVKSDTHKTDQPEQISTKSVEPKAAEAEGLAKPESAPQQPEVADDKPAEATDDKPAELEKVDEPCDDELGKGESGPVIAELTAKMIARVNDECRDRATINRNLRATCEKLGLQFPTVPALIQAIGYGNAYKACVGE